MVRIPTYRHHKPSGLAVVTLGGKDHYLGEYGSKESRKQYNRLISEYLASDGLVASSNPDSNSVSEILAAFLRYARRHYGDSTRTEYGHYVRIVPIIKNSYGQTVAKEFGPLQFKTVRQGFLNEGHARKYVNANMKRVIRIFRWASGEGLVPPSVHQVLRDVEPLRMGRTTARETEAIRPVANEVVDQTIPQLPPVVADMVRFQRLVGCRPGEVCIIKPSMVDRSTDIWEINLSNHKTAWRGKKRTIFVGPKAQAILSRYLLRESNEYCFQPSESERKRRDTAHEERVTPLSCGNVPGSRKQKRRRGDLPPRVGPLPGKCYTTASYGRAIQRACDVAFPPPASLKKQDEIKAWVIDHRWSPNQLRHTFGTMVRSEFGLEESQVLLGHASANVSEIYAERDSEKARVAARKIG